jgi:hypothetical protein
MDTTAEKAARQWREFDVYLVQAGEAWGRDARRRLVDETAAAADGYRRGNEGAAINAIRDAVWIEYLTRLYRSVTVHAGERAAELLDVAADTALLTGVALGYLDRNAEPRGAGIAETSRDNVRRWIRQGRDEDEAPATIGRRIAAEGRTASQWRSMLIATTETHGASWLGAWSAARHSHLSLTKIWEAPRRAGVTCDQHKSTHGQRRPLIEPFHVLNDYEPGTAEDAMQHPGDAEMGARASNIINCRCAMDFDRVVRSR